MSKETPYKLSANGDIQILTIFELLSEYSNREILQAAQNRIEAGFATFVVDMSKVAYVNSVGLNFLITLQSRSNDNGGEIVIANVSSKIMQLLDITKLKPLFQITNSVDKAIHLIATQ